MRAAWLLGCVIGIVPMAWADPITFNEALARASADSPSVAAQTSALKAASLLVKPAGQLPDPQVALGIDNLPVTGIDRFRLNRDEMTMLSVGIMQDMPSDAARQARTTLAVANVGAARADVEVAKLRARLAAAQAWIDLYYGRQRVALLEQLLKRADDLEEAASQHLAAAAGSADRALVARVRSAGIADRLGEARSAVTMAVAELERWVGPLNGDLPGPEAPILPVDAEAIRAHLEHHAELGGSSAAIARAQAGLEAARASTQPDWSLGAMYQKRDDSFGDMVSFQLKFSLPLFQSDRQAPTIDARRADVQRAGSEREVLLREHRAMIEAGLAQYAQLVEQVRRARDVVLPASKRLEALAQAAQATSTTGRADLISAQMETVEADLSRLNLEQKLLAISASLNLEYGEILS